uniref:Uncharacterized protein n=1 Tax=Anguilla anguilla TaxID=7936 RepID=A0A0E9WUA7_ANGAN
MLLQLMQPCLIQNFFDLGIHSKTFITYTDQDSIKKISFMFDMQINSV